MTDSWPALALGAEQGGKEIMQRKPRPEENFYTASNALFLLQDSLDIYCPCVVSVGVRDGQHYAKATTMALTTLIVFEIFRAYSCKSTKPFGNLFSNKWMHLAALLSLGLHLLILYTPLHVAFKTVGLTLGDWLLVLMFSFIGQPY